LKHVSRDRLALAFLVMLTCVACEITTGDRMWVKQAPGAVPATAAVELEPWTAQASTGPARPSRAAAPTQTATSGTRAGDASTPPALSPGSYTQATRYGDLLFISGQIALDLASGKFQEKRTVEEETRATMENIKTILAANRLTLANLVSVTVYIKNINDLSALDQTYESYFKGALPARSVVEVARLPRGALLEISAVAGR